MNSAEKRGCSLSILHFLLRLACCELKIVKPIGAPVNCLSISHAKENGKTSTWILSCKKRRSINNFYKLHFWWNHALLRSCVSRVWNWYFSENNLYFSTSFLTWKHYQYHYFYNMNSFQVFVCFFMVYFDSVFVIINPNRKGQNEFTDSTQHEQPSLCKNINHNAN